MAGRENAMTTLTKPVTIKVAADAWLDHLERRKRSPAKPATLATFGSYVSNWIIPQVGGINIAVFGNANMRDFVAFLASRDLAPKTINEISSALKSIVVSVVDPNTGDQLYPRKFNSDFIDLPRVNPREQKTPTVTCEDIERAIRDSTEPYSILYAFLAGTGLRINEALAVRLDDPTGSHSVFDAASSTIHIRTGLWRGREQESPKTSAVIRSLEVPSELATMLTRFAGNRTGF